jgi:hypothetical protein
MRRSGFAGRHAEWLHSETFQRMRILKYSAADIVSPTMARMRARVPLVAQAKCRQWPQSFRRVHARGFTGRLCFLLFRYSNLCDWSRSIQLHESPKPIEFGGVGMNWDSIGWKIRVNFIEMRNKVRPKDHMDVLRPILPGHYSPLQTTGNGNQGVYLTEVGRDWRAHCV